MASDDSLPTLKLLLIGPSGAGKSALLTRYCEDLFEPENAAATIGLDFKVRGTLEEEIKKLSVRGQAYRLTLFDTAGQERFRTLSTSYYRGAHGVLLVYDVSSRTSFASMEKWFDEAEMNTTPGVALYLVGAKTDKPRAVAADEGRTLAGRFDALFCEVSAKTGENVRKPFVEIVDAVVAQGLPAGGGRRGGTVRVGGPGDAGAASSGCSC